MSVGAAFLERTLRPYKPHCRYLQDCVITLPEAGPGDSGPLAVADGTFHIPESCYIDDTGHLNAVEFIIAYNQIMYTLVGSCVAEGAIPALQALDVEGWFASQLPDVLIHDVRCTFKQVIDARSFRGRMRIHDAVLRRGLVRLRTDIGFRDARGGNSRGDIVLAIVGQDQARPERSHSEA